MSQTSEETARDRIEVCFRGDAFAAAVPFGFVVNPDGQVTLVGRALARWLKGPFPQPIDALFEDVSKRKSASLLEAVRGAGPSLTLCVRDTKVFLKGEAVELEEGGPLAFMGRPIVQSLEQLRDCGLQLRDFAAADSTPDLLMAMQATKTALTDARELSDKLKDSVVKAESAVVAKSRFLAIMSHEIRTPMNGLGSMVDLLKDSGLTNEQAELLKTIDDCSSTLGALLDDVLDFSKLEASAVEVERIPLVLPELIDRVVRVFQAKADQHDVNLRVEFDEALPPCVEGDPTRIRQVLSNLLSNAIKFSSGGTVTVMARSSSEGPVAIYVTDTGVGIPRSAVDTLFQPFVQADNSTTRKFGGTGLGLSIARGLARAMGGDLRLEASSPEGSTFCFLLDAPESTECTASEHDEVSSEEEASDDAQAAIEADALAKLFVLVADDNSINLVIAQRLLKKLGVRSETVTDGQEAIEAVRNKRYDLVLMDLMMPNVGGVDASKAIRALDVPWSELPIIAFSAGVVRAARDEAVAAGMNEFLAKPVRLSALREALLRNAPAA